MTVFVVFKNGRFMDIYRTYDEAKEAVGNYYWDSSNPDEIEILPYKI